MPADPLAPFRSADESRATRLEGAVDSGDYRRRHGFHDAAVLLLQAAVGSEDWTQRDRLIWPALYNFRHYFELELKHLLNSGGALGIGPAPAHHKLRPLWSAALPGLHTCFGDSVDEPAQILEQALDLFEALDPGGDGLRYATTRKGDPSLKADVYLDPQALLALVSDVFSALEATDLAFDYEITSQAEIRAAFDPG